MTHGAKLTLKYDSKFEYTGTYYGDDILPEEHITMEIPAEDLSTMQLFRFFSNFLRSIGHNEYGIMKGACNLAFNEMNNEDDMKKLAHEFDLVMEEHIDARIKVYEELAENWEKRYWDLRRNMQKKQNEDCMPPWGHSDMEALRYTEEELNAMCDEAAKDKVVKWQLPIELDGPSGEYYVIFPDDLLEAANLKEGDQVNWTDRGDGSFELRKVNGSK